MIDRTLDLWAKIKPLFYTAFVRMFNCNNGKSNYDKDHVSMGRDVLQGKSKQTFNFSILIKAGISL